MSKRGERFNRWQCGRRLCAIDAPQIKTGEMTSTREQIGTAQIAGFRPPRVIPDQIHGLFLVFFSAIDGEIDARTSTTAPSGDRRVIKLCQ
ncbi:MAG: hypothetical protein HYV95_06835 [Opitutae bacterium]|nr:hypothetical protein [Opitutae bacterium]